MTQAARVATNRSMIEATQQVVKRTLTFQLVSDMPDFLVSRLAELDRVEAARAAARGDRAS